MRQLFLSITAFFFSIPVLAQWPGLTGVPDTSFTVFSAFQKIKKEFPEARLPSSQIPAGITLHTDVTYMQRGTRILKTDVFVPTTKSTSRPAVLLIFGGGWRSGEKTQLHALAAKLAENGYVTITPEYRLSTEALYPAAVLDLKEALVWLKEQAKQYTIDTSRVSVLGFSAGGQLAALIGNTPGFPAYRVENHANRPSEAVRSIVDLDGVLAFIHPESGEGMDDRSVSAATNWFGGNKRTKEPLWQQASALNHISKNSPPILFLNSSVARMHAGRDDMVKALSVYGVYSEIHDFPGAPHVFPLYDPWFDDVMKFTLTFLETTGR